MTLHAIAAYLKYRWTAKGRHGTHSPFVYDFVEAVLQNRGKLVIDRPETIDELSPENNTLISRIREHYQYSHISKAGEHPTKEQLHKSILILTTDKPELWNEIVAKHMAIGGDDYMLLLPGIHQSADHTNAWAQIVAMRDVMMSIDLYGAGLVVCRKDFKEKQHFVLMYTT